MGLFDRLTPREGEEEYLVDDGSNVAKKDSPAPAISGKAKNQFVILRPNDPSDDQLISIAEHLMNLQSVIVNLELIGKDAKHFIDFLSGV
ncbi:MAG: cell division protein SepF, partial [Clostridia bacterium]|nr:cell division protein SepF [Clostridia bacterium]